MPTTTFDHFKVANNLRRLIKRANSTENLRYLAIKDRDTERVADLDIKVKAIHQSIRNLCARYNVSVDPQLVLTVLTPTSRVPFDDGHVA